MPYRVVGADDNQVFGKQHIAVKAGLFTVFFDIVNPFYLPGIFVKSIKISSARTDKKEISRDLGSTKNSAAAVELP